VQVDDIALVQASGLFEPDFYSSRYPDVVAAGVDPLEHFLREGGAQGREPGRRFWSAWYREIFPNVRRSGENPLVHYLRHGRGQSHLAKSFERTSAITSSLDGPETNRTNREVFNMFWHGAELSATEGACMRSFLQRGHELHVFTYAPVSLPAGAIAEDAADILPFDTYFSFLDSPSPFSNIFRYKLLLERGGWWVDTDVVCLRYHVPACDYYWAFQDRFEDNGINGAILKFPAGDARCEKLLKLSLDRAAQLSRWGQLGPQLLTEVLTNDHPEGLAGATKDAYPIRWVETYFAWLPEFAAAIDERCKEASFLHLWHRMFSEMGIQIRRRPPSGSFLEQLCHSLGEPLGAPPDDILGTRRAVAKYLNREWNLNHLSECLGKNLSGVIPVYDE
jgi:hypothetical protein